MAASQDSSTRPKPGRCRASVNRSWLREPAACSSISYAEAEVFSEQANYPEGAAGLYPQAEGDFSSATIDGLRIYIPLRQAIG